MNEVSRGDPIFTMPRRRVSWGAIWAGMFVTVIMEIMFILLGMACGIASLSPASNVRGLSVGAMIWIMLSWLISVWVGACVAGWMAAGPRRADGTVHGIVVWSFASAVILLLLTGAIGTLLGSSNELAGVGPGRGQNSLAAQGQALGSALAPTGRAGEQTPYPYGQSAQNPYSHAPASSGHGAYQPFWGSALFTFIALALGLAVAASGGAAGVARSDRSVSATPA